jgi:hypothetical protein
MWCFGALACRTSVVGNGWDGSRRLDMYVLMHHVQPVGQLCSPIGLLEARMTNFFFFCAFFWSRNPSFCHRLPIIATQHLIFNAFQRMCAIGYIWHDLYGQFVALLFCKYSQKSSHNPTTPPSRASTPATFLTGWASKCNILALLQQ